MAAASIFRRTSPTALPSRDANEAPAPAPRPDFSALACVGVELAEPIATMQYVVQEFQRKRSLGDNHLLLLQGAVEAARRVARQSQHLAHVVHGKIRQSHERLRLDELLKAALDEHRSAFRSRGVELTQSIRAVEVIVDPGLLTALLEAAMAWALGVGQKLHVSLDIKNWPANGLLLLKASESIATGQDQSGAPADAQSLNWHLLQQLANAMGVSVDCVKSEREAVLMLEFARTVQQLEGLTAVEVETGFDSLGSEPRALAGHRVLVVTEDEKLGFDIRLIARGMSLEVDTVPGALQAVRACELDLPHIIIIDERVRNAVFNQLRDDLLRLDPNYPFVEIATASNILEMASWMTESMARVSRDSLRSQLPSILALELARIM